MMPVFVILKEIGYVEGSIGPADSMVRWGKKVATDEASPTKAIIGPTKTATRFQCPSHHGWNSFWRCGWIVFCLAFYALLIWA
jgi:hypothetical protein